MNIEKLDEQVALLTKITEALLKEAPKEKYSKQFKELSKTSAEFRLPTFQQMHDDIKKAKNAAQLGTTSRGYLGLIKQIEDQIILVFNDSKKFNQSFYEDLFRQFFKIKYLILQGVKLEPVDPSFDSDDADKNKIYGKGAKFPTTAQQMGRRPGFKDEEGRNIPPVDREQAQKNYKDAIAQHINNIGIDRAMRDNQEAVLDRDLEIYAGAEVAQTYKEEAAEDALKIVSSIAQDLQRLDPASSEVEAAAEDVEEILSQDEINELESYLKDIEKDQAEGLFIPHPDFNPNDPNSPGYEEAMNADLVDMTKLKTLTEPQRLAILAAEIRKRGLETAKRKEAYKNRTPDQILADQVKRQKDKEEKEKRILDQINSKDMTPDQIIKVIQDEFGEDAASMSKKQTFDKIGMISLAMKSAESKDDKKALKSAVATIRQRLQKDFAKTKFLQHDEDEIADLTQFLVEVYASVMENIFSHSEDEYKVELKDVIKVYDSEVASDKESLEAIRDLKDKASPEAISAYYQYQEMANEVAAEIAEMDRMDQEERFDLQAKVSALMDMKKEAENVRAMLEDFTGLRQLATSSTYDYYAKNVWARAEKELAAAIKTYCVANGIPEQIMTSKSITDKITYYAMGRTYFGELEGQPMSPRSKDQIDQFAYDLIGHRMGSKRGASIPRQAAKTKGFEDYEMSVEEGRALAEDCVSKDGVIGSIIHKIFAPTYDEVSLVDEVKKFYRSRGPAYLFSKVYEGMLYGAFYRKNPMGIEIPEVFKDTWMKGADNFYKLINKESTPSNKLRDDLTKLIGE